MTPTETLAAELDVLADLNHAVQDDGYPTALDRVWALRVIAETAERALRQAVPLARQEGASWEDIGRALGTTRQSAHERFGGPTGWSQ